MRPWTRNDLVIVGPPSDPAGIAGMTDSVAALRKIAETRSNFLDVQSIGAREVAHSLWKKTGVTPQGEWFLKDESGDHLSMPAFAEQHNAYMIQGRMPFTYGKLPMGNLKIMVENDPQMTRPYIVMEANPELCPGANAAGARALSDFMLSDTVQKFLAEFGKDKNLGVNAFRPVRTPPQK